jgi:hypothetical protein
MIDNQDEKSTRRGKAQKIERKRCKNGRWKSGDRGKDGVRGRKSMIPAQAAIGFGRILSCEDIVGHGDDGKQNQDKYGQGDKLYPPVRASMRGKAQPQAEQQDPQQYPSEIEDQLHIQNRFYIRVDARSVIGSGLTPKENPLMMNKLAFGVRRPAVTQANAVAR